MDIKDDDSSGNKQIITIGIGKCGTRMSYNFWKEILKDHKCDKEGKFYYEEPIIYDDDNSSINTDISFDDNKISSNNINNNDKDADFYLQRSDTFFKYDNDKSEITLLPRGIFIDLDPFTSDRILSSDIGSIISPDSVISGKNSACNLFPRGMITLGQDIIDDIYDCIRKQTEDCNCLQGFILNHSIGGGTGSGLTSSILNYLRDEYSDSIINDYVVFPSKNVSDIVIEPYNCLLTMPYLMKNSDIIYCIDNEALYNISNNILKHKLPPNFNILNEMITNVMSSTTASLRFGGPLNSDLRKQATNLVPFPRLKFMTIRDSPLLCIDDIKHNVIDIPHAMRELWTSKYYSTNIDMDDGKIISAAVSIRGNNCKTSDADLSTKYIKTVYNDKFVTWLPDHIHASIINEPNNFYPYSVTGVFNTTSIVQLFKQQLNKFNKLHNKKAYLHHYQNEGMSLDMFTEAKFDLMDLMDEYTDKQNLDITIDDIETKEYVNDMDMESEYDEESELDIDDTNEHALNEKQIKSLIELSDDDDNDNDDDSNDESKDNDSDTQDIASHDHSHDDSTISDDDDDDDNDSDNNTSNTSTTGNNNNNNDDDSDSSSDDHDDSNTDNDNDTDDDDSS